MEKEVTIGIKARTEPKYSEKAKRKWFSIVDFSDAKYICWKEELFDQLKLGGSPQVRIVEEPGKTPKIVAILTQKEAESKPPETDTDTTKKTSTPPKITPQSDFKPFNAEQRRDRSVVLSYAKDMATNELIKPEEILEWANTFYKWLKEEY